MAKQKKILLIDDEPDILKVAVFQLKNAGYEVVTASNGKKALETAVKEIPDLVLCDLGLPDIDGSDVCRRLKKNKALKHIPIIAFTARYSSEVPDGERALPIDDYLIKPYEPQELLSKINKLLK